MLSVMSNFGNEMAIAEQPSNYINNMTLPGKVKATRLQPLGPDCIISKDDVTDPDLLRTVQYYWCISRETGCVECVIKKSNTKNVAATDPRCVVTKKHRRFEAYCCTICRFNFVTIVQALSHFKAIHRANSKILIQDKDVFHNIEKAMEVPPVPLPWHVAKKLIEQGKPMDEIPNPTYVIPPGALTASTVADTVATKSSVNATVPNSVAMVNSEYDEANSEKSPMMCMIAALYEKFHKPISNLKFEEDCSQLIASFTDGTSAIAEIPDLSYTNNTSGNIPSEDESDGPLMFFVDETASHNGNHTQDVEIVTLRCNRPSYARKLLAKTVKAATPEVDNQDIPDHELTPSKDYEEPYEKQASENPPEETVSDFLKPQPYKPPKKSVRFTVGHPDSDEERPATPEYHDHDSRAAEHSKQERTKELPIIKVSNPLGKTIKDKEDNGLQTVINNLISTASKGSKIIAPTSPIPSNSPMNALPHVGSSPALFSMALPTSTTSSSLTRVQSWSPSVAPSPFSVASMRRPYTARGFTYAEKIQYMKQQNDYDAEFVTKHIKDKAKSSKSSEDARSSSDGEERITPRRKNQSYSEDDEGSRDEDSDSQESEAAMAAAYSTLLQRGLFSANIFPSEYYGSGEWASAAIETLKNLQPILRSQDDTASHHSQFKEISPNRNSETDLYKRSSNASRVYSDNSKDSLSDDNVSVKTKPNFTRKRCKSSNESSSSAAIDLGSPQRKKHRSYIKFPIHSKSVLSSGVDLQSASPPESEPIENWSKSPSKNVVDKIPNQPGKVPLSPLLSESEKDRIQHHHFTKNMRTEPSSTLTISKISLNEPKVKHLTVSKLSSKSMAKCPSDPALSSSASLEHRTSPSSSPHANPRISAENKLLVKQTSSSSPVRADASLLLHADDRLELLENVRCTDCSMKTVITKLSAKDDDITKQTNVLTGMPEVFRNCIETRVKIRVIEKNYACKVCGFSVDATDEGTLNEGDGRPLDTLEAHVMEHSLKELYATKL